MEETGIDITGSEISEIEGSLTGESEKTLKETDERVMVEMVFYNFTVKLSQHSDAVEVKTEDDFVEPKWVEADRLSEYQLSPPSVVTLQKLGYLPESDATL